MLQSQGGPIKIGIFINRYPDCQVLFKKSLCNEKILKTNMRNVSFENIKPISVQNANLANQTHNFHN